MCLQLSKLTIYWFSCLACPKLALVKKVTLKVKKFSWLTAQKVSIPKIQCEWPMQLLFAVFREETCTYSWAVAQQSLESFHSFGNKIWWTIKLFLCFFMLFQVCLVVYLDLLLSTIKNKRKTTKKTKSSLRVWVS